ncbi:YaiI/YqxD family protein [Syntrophomonas curvata]
MATKILVDADACPRSVLQICFRTAPKYDIPVWTVASFDHNIESDYHVVVGNASQEADLKIINLTEAGDVVVTQDWGLAAMVMGKGAQALSPAGLIYKADTMDFLLEEREIKAKLRRAGGRTKGPKKRTAEDDRRFEYSLNKCLQ